MYLISNVFVNKNLVFSLQSIIAFIAIIATIISSS